MAYFLRGGSSQIFWKTRFWDNGWPKKYTQWAKLLAGFGVPRPNGATVAPAPKNRHKWRLFLESDLGAIWGVQSIDNGPLSYHKKFEPDISKNGRVMAKKRMSIRILEVIIFPKIFILYIQNVYLNPLFEHYDTDKVFFHQSYTNNWPKHDWTEKIEIFCLLSISSIGKIVKNLLQTAR